jgi:hypothetical protein
MHVSRTFDRTFCVFHYSTSLLVPRGKKHTARYQLQSRLSRVISVLFQYILAHQVRCYDEPKVFKLSVRT